MKNLSPINIEYWKLNIGYSVIKKISLLSFILFLGFNLHAQPYDKAPETKKKVKRITEWVSPSLKAKSVKGMASSFDQNGHLLNYTSGGEPSILNTYNILNKKGVVLETREGKGIDLLLTRYTYKSDRTIKEWSFRGKLNREVVFFNKKKQKIEMKTYSKGLELGNKFQLKERVIYKYNTRKQLVSEKIMVYNMPNSKKFDTRKKTYHYHSSHRYLLKTIEYDFDGTVSIVEDYAYTDIKLSKAPMYKVKLIISNYLKDKTVATKEFLYKKGKIWQKITTERGIRHVEVFADGRLIRLRSYNNENIYRVVDYQYEYY